MRYNHEQRHLPMTNDSTPVTPMADTKNNSPKSPRLSSILYLQQFARVYMNVGSNSNTMLIIN